jgi:hypothetical protein
MAILTMNPATAKALLNSPQLKNILKNSRKKEQLLAKAFEFIGKSQPRIGYDTLTIKADLSTDPKGEVSLTVQLGNFGTTNHKMFELAYSRKMRVFSFDEEKPNLV